MTVPERDCPIIGTWRLRAYEVRPHNGAAAGRPRWTRFAGQLVYTAGGRMSVHISTLDQRPFEAERRWDGTPDEKARAFDDYLAYAGTFRWEGDRVVHVIEQSLFPNWVGGEQVRMATLEDGLLVLTDTAAREDASVVLIWERVEDGTARDVAPTGATTAEGDD